MGASTPAVTGGTMGSYLAARSATTDCLHFIRGDGDLSDFGDEIAVELAKKGVKVVYVNFSDFASSGSSLATILGEELNLDFRPFEPPGPVWVRFLDSLGMLSRRLNGLVIVVDCADILLEKRRDEVCDLIEAFLHQLHHWYDNKKPCHLFFQLDESKLVRQHFGS